MPVLSTVEAHLSLHKRNITKQSQKHGNGKKPVANYDKQRSESALVLQYVLLCPVNELHDPVDLQSQLECISHH